MTQPLQLPFAPLQDSHAEIVLCTCGSVKRSQTGGKDGLPGFGPRSRCAATWSPSRLQDVSALFPRAVGLEPEALIQLNGEGN